jgi:hypothetical protein
VTIGGSGSYLSNGKISDRIQQTSVICNRPAKTEHLHLSHNVLKGIVDAQALKVDGVTQMGRLLVGVNHHGSARLALEDSG